MAPGPLTGKAISILWTSSCRPARTRKNAEKLSGERAKIVFILSEMGYSDVEIAEFTCTSVDSVRTLGNNNQRTLADERGD